MRGIKPVGILILVLLALPAGVATSAPPAADEAIAAVEKVEQARQQAMVSVDQEAMARIFATDLVYVHSTGLAQSKEDLIGMLVRGDIRYVAFKVENVAYRAYGSTVIGTGVQAIDLTSSSRPFVSRSRFTVVYVVVDGAYRLASYQSTTMPEIVMQETGGERRAP